MRDVDKRTSTIATSIIILAVFLSACFSYCLCKLMHASGILCTRSHPTPRRCFLFQLVCHHIFRQSSIYNSLLYLALLASSVYSLFERQCRQMSSSMLSVTSYLETHTLIVSFDGRCGSTSPPALTPKLPPA